LELVAQEQVLDHNVVRSWEKADRVGTRMRRSSSIQEGLPMAPDVVLPSYTPFRRHLFAVFRPTVGLALYGVATLRARRYW